MASEYLQENQQLMQQPADQQNAFATPQAQLFATYFQNRHDPSGHMYTADQDGLSMTQRMELQNYEARRSREQDMRNNGVGEADIALFRKWDEDAQESNLSGKPLDFNKMFSAEYSNAATQSYQYNESMYNTYVSNSRLFAKEQYDPDGDGHYNLTLDMMKEFKDYNDEELANVYDNMTHDGHTFMGFDGIHDRKQFVDATRKMIRDYDNAHSGAGYNFMQFLKGIPNGFISAIMDVVKLPLSVVSLVGAAFTGSFDNGLSRTMGSWMKTVDEGTTGAYQKAVDMDPNNGWAKAGGFVGQALEIAAEVALTGGLATVAREGSKLAVKAGEKMIEHGMEKAGERVVTRYSAKAIESEAFKLAQKAGTKVNEEIIMQAARKVGGEVESEAALKALQNGVSVATVRLARRGAYHASKAEIEKIGIKAAEEEVASTATKAAEKGIYRVTKDVAAKEAEKTTEKAAVKGTEKVAEKETEKTVAKEGEAQVAKQAEKKSMLQKGADYIAEKMAQKEAGKFGYHSFGLKRTLRKGTNEHLVASMASKPNTVLGKAYRMLWGKRDPVTKMFALKSFAAQVDKSQARGENPYTSFLRASFAYGTTNFIWGKLSPEHGENAIVKMFERNTGKVGKEAAANEIKATAESTATQTGETVVKDATTSEVKKVPNAVSSKLKSALISNAAQVITVAGKMFADGSLQKVVGDVLTKGDDGKIHWNIGQALKDQFTIDNITHTFLSSLSMEITGKAWAYSGGLAIRKVADPIMSKVTFNSTMREMDAKMSDSNNGLGADLWNSFKDQSRQKLGKDAKEEDVIDDALQQIIIGNPGTAISEMASKHYTSVSASLFTRRIIKNLEDVSKEIEKTVNAAREKMLDFTSEFNQHKDHDSEILNTNFKLFVEHAIMNNANFFDGQEIPEDLKHINNWQPEDMMVAYAFFKELKIDLSKPGNEDVYTPMKKSFEKAAFLRKTLGGKYFKYMLSLSHEQIIKLHEKLNDPSMKDDAANKFKFIVDFKEALKESNEQTRREKIDKVMKDHDITIQDVKNEVASGAGQETQTVLTELEKQQKADEEKVKNLVSNGDYKGVAEHLLEKGKVEDKYRDPLEGLNELEQMKDLNDDQKFEIINHMYEMMDEDKFVKESLPSQWNKPGSKYSKFILVHDIYKAKQEIKFASEKWKEANATKDIPVKVKKTERDNLTGKVETVEVEERDIVNNPDKYLSAADIASDAKNKIIKFKNEYLLDADKEFSERALKSILGDEYKMFSDSGKIGSEITVINKIANEAKRIKGDSTGSYKQQTSMLEPTLKALEIRVGEMNKIMKDVYDAAKALLEKGDGASEDEVKKIVEKLEAVQSTLDAKTNAEQEVKGKETVNIPDFEPEEIPEPQVTETTSTPEQNVPEETKAEEKQPVPKEEYESPESIDEKINNRFKKMMEEKEEKTEVQKAADEHFTNDVNPIVYKTSVKYFSEIEKITNRLKELAEIKKNELKNKEIKEIKREEYLLNKTIDKIKNNFSNLFDFITSEKLYGRITEDDFTTLVKFIENEFMKHHENDDDMMVDIYYDINEILYEKDHDKDC